ncbi:hypothetical protein ACLM5H_18630 [Fredinandcohnia humi]
MSLDKIRLWMVNESSEVRKLLDQNVECIITDYPEMAESLRNDR